MTTLIESRPQSLTGDELTKILATYLAKVGDTEIVDQDEPGGLEADEVLVQLLKPELEEIKVPMVVANLAVRAAVVAMSESPSEAILQIAELVSKARQHLRDDIEEAREA